jgi:hypothetical protein
MQYTIQYNNANLTGHFSEVTDLIKFLDIWYAF